MWQTFTQNQRKNLQSPGKNKLSCLGDKVEVKNQSEKVLKMLCYKKVVPKS